MHIKDFMTKKQRARLLFEAILKRKGLTVEEWESDEEYRIKHSNGFCQWTTAEIQEYEEILNREENKRAY